MKTKYYYYAGGALVLIAFVLWLLWRKGNTDEATRATEDKFPLKLGSKGPEVTLLQSVINARLKQRESRTKQLVQDGKFGPKTEAAMAEVFEGKKTITEPEYNVLKSSLTQTDNG